MRLRGLRREHHLSLMLLDLARRLIMCRAIGMEKSLTMKKHLHEHGYAEA